MPKKPVAVEWQVARDAQMRQVVQKGSATAHPELGHAVHVEVGGLDPARDYFYRFSIGRERSRIGRARTLPPPGASPTQIRFAAAGCQRYEDGYFTAWRAIAEERFDFVFHYGDYIYEYRLLRPGERPCQWCVRCPASPTRSTPSTTTATATRSTRLTPICRSRTRPRPSS
jgi:alkaline phosphatase D